MLHTPHCPRLAGTAMLQNTKSLYMLYPEGTCKQLGLEAAVNTSLSTFLQAMVNASNPPMAAALLNSRISSLNNATAGAGEPSAAAAQVGIGTQHERRYDIRDNGKPSLGFSGLQTVRGVVDLGLRFCS